MITREPILMIGWLDVSSVHLVLAAVIQEAAPNWRWPWPEGPRSPLSYAWDPSTVIYGTAILCVALLSMDFPPSEPLHMASFYRDSLDFFIAW